MKKEAILERYKDLDEVEVRAELIKVNAKLKIERACGQWLDCLADELRAGDETDQSADLYQAYRDLQWGQKSLLEEKYGLKI